MSYSASTIGLPVLRHSNSASAGRFWRTLSARRNRTRPRSCAVVVDQGPSSNAAFAANTARLTSSASASGTCAITSSVDGSYTGNVFEDLLATHSPLINIEYVLTSVVTPPGIRTSCFTAGAQAPNLD